MMLYHIMRLVVNSENNVRVGHEAIREFSPEFLELLRCSRCRVTCVSNDLEAGQKPRLRDLETELTLPVFGCCDGSLLRTIYVRPHYT